MTPELGPSARALLDAAREGMSPDSAAIRRMRPKVDAAVAVTSAGGLATNLLLVLACAISIGIGGGVYTSRARATEVPLQLELPGIQVKTPAPIVRRAFESVALASAPAAAPAPRRRAATVPPGAIDLAREVELIDQAMAALKRRDAEAALRQIHTYAVESHDAGQLAEDAAAIEIEALCQLRDPGVPAKLEAFDARFPRSAQRSRLVGSCP